LHAANLRFVAGAVGNDAPIAEGTMFFDMSQNTVVYGSKFRSHGCRASIGRAIGEFGIVSKYV
jgi:hypothetical protein